MKYATEPFDIVIAGAGIGGICAALSAAREHCRVLLIEKEDQVGGTGIFSPVGLICKFWDRDRNPVISGIHKELFSEIYASLDRVNERVPVYDETILLKRYLELLRAEKTLTVWTGTEVVRAETHNGKIQTIFTTGKYRFAVGAKVFLDATADGNLSALAGAEFLKGRPGDGRMMSATLTFKMSGFDKSKITEPDINSWRGIRGLREELDVYYRQMKARGETENLRDSVLCFPYPRGDALLFNSTAILDADPTEPESVRKAMKEGKKQIRELAAAIRKHPAFTDAKIDFISKKLGIREGRRITGDYILTGGDCLSQARFNDMIAAGAYDIDIHNPDGGSAIPAAIPGTGYYHIPYRCIIAKNFSNLLLSSRCISGDFEAHSSYRVMSNISGFAQAAGAAAALTVTGGFEDVRQVPASKIRYVLKRSGQFTEGDTEKPEQEPD